MMERLEDVMRFAQSLQRDKDTNQVSLFGAATGQPPPTIPRRSTNRPEWPVNQKLAHEREALGSYISGHPLEKFRNYLKHIGVSNTLDVKSKPREGNGKQPEVRIAGVVTALKLKNTKKGDRYASFTLEDWQGAIETIVWPDTYRKVATMLESDVPIVVSGRPDITEERCTLIADKMESLLGIQEQSATRGVLALGEENDFGKQLELLPTIFSKYSGKCPIRVKFSIEGQEVGVLLRDHGENPICVKPSDELRGEIEQLFGRDVLEFV
jgi:DNA polymerase-3 subunit alpha